MKIKENIIENEILPFLCLSIKEIFNKIDSTLLTKAEEIRLRANRPLIIHKEKEDWYIGKNGELFKNPNNSYITTQQEIIKTLEIMSENSVYAFAEDIRQGFLTLKGGHRVGLTGRAVLEQKSIKTIKDVSSLNIRISRQIIGCSNLIIKYILSKEKTIYNTLVIAPPQCGKTTILRDISRVISNGNEESRGLKVCIVDERSEIAACFKGIPQNDVGLNTDVLDACPKSIGMSMLLRSMSPDVIVTDEIGNEGDTEALLEICNAGVSIISSAHGFSISELKTRKEVLKIIEEQVFERFIILSSRNGPGTVEEVICGKEMKILYRRN